MSHASIKQCTLDCNDFDICVDYIKGKQTSKKKKGTEKSLKILEIIHLDICNSNIDSCSQNYFIFFIDDYS